MVILNLGGFLSTTLIFIYGAWKFGWQYYFKVALRGIKMRCLACRLVCVFSRVRR